MADGNWKMENTQDIQLQEFCLPSNCGNQLAREEPVLGNLDMQDF